MRWWCDVIYISISVPLRTMDDLKITDTNDRLSMNNNDNQKNKNKKKNYNIKNFMEKNSPIVWYRW